MSKFSMWFQRLTYGRYGTDSLNKFLLVASVVLLVLNILFHSYLLKLLAVIALILVYCRMFSRNFRKRASENQKFLEMTGKFRNNGNHGSYRSGTAYYSQPFKTTKTEHGNDKSHRILTCPACGGKLRVPRGVGKISIKCPHCTLKFIKKV